MDRPLTEEETAELNKPKPPPRKVRRKAEKAARKKGKKTKKSKVVNFDKLHPISEDAAGLDIGAGEIYACVPQDRDSQFVRKFQTFTVDLNALANWLEKCGIRSVAMESTGVYWIPIYEILESRGFDVNLVNARHIKNVPGKKSDVQDCQWIQKLHSYGLLSASFRPDEDMCMPRSLTRNRQMLIAYRSSHIQHIQKSLEQMNLKLTQVIGDITGVTGMKIIRAIIKGERDPVKLAQFRDPRCASSKKKIAKSLEGNFKSEHLFVLMQAVELYDHYCKQIYDCDVEIQKNYSAIKCAKGPGDELPPLPKKRIKNKKHLPHYDLRTEMYELCGVDLTAIDGLEATTVQTVLHEIGIDMSKWKTVKHFTSWLGLCPYNDISGGKVLKRGSKKNKNRATVALRVAAQSLWRSQSAMGAFYRRMRAKHGPTKANKAAAHKIARIIYFMLKNKEPYQDPGVEFYEQKYQNRVLKNLKRRAAALGYELKEVAA